MNYGFPGRDASWTPNGSPNAGLQRVSNGSEPHFLARIVKGFIISLHFQQVSNNRSSTGLKRKRAQIPSKENY